MLPTHHFTRRGFIQTSSALALSLTGLPAFAKEMKSPKLAFSTLGCPDWTLQQIVDFAVKHDFTGIEVRGLLRQMDLPQCKEFSQENIPATLRLLSDRGLKFINLGSGASLHFSDPATRKKNIDDGKRFIDLASKLNCPFVRVFPNNFPKEQTKSQSMELMAKGMLELAEFAEGSDVTVLLETHGDLLYIEDLVQVMQACEHKHTGLVWDMTNMWVKTKESPALAYTKLKKYIHHTHIKNARLVDDKLVYTRIAQGEVPIFEMIDALIQGGYDGYYSFEWEKMWHPELEEPELAIADYAKVMKDYFQKQ